MLFVLFKNFPQLTWPFVCVCDCLFDVCFIQKLPTTHMTVHNFFVCFNKKKTSHNSHDRPQLRQGKLGESLGEGDEGKPWPAGHHVRHLFFISFFLNHLSFFKSFFFNHFSFFKSFYSIICLCKIIFFSITCLFLNRFFLNHLSF